MTSTTLIKKTRSAATETELSDAALQLLPADWRQRARPWDDDDITTFHALATGSHVWARPLTRTWLLSEIDDLANRISLATAHVETFPDLEWDLPLADPHHATLLPLRVRAISAVDRLMDLLTLPEVRVAELAGVSRNSIRNWRRGHDVYPATVKRLLQVANLVSALEASLGRELMLAWLDEPGADAVPRRDLLADPDGHLAVAREAGALLFGRPASALPPTELLGVEPTSGAVSEAAPHLYTARERRPRPDPTR